MPHPQFSLKTMLWLTALVAAFLGDMAMQRAMMDHPHEADGVENEN